MIFEHRIAQEHSTSACRQGRVLLHHHPRTDRLEMVLIESSRRRTDETIQVFLASFAEDVAFSPSRKRLLVHVAKRWPRKFGQSDKWNARRPEPTIMFDKGLLNMTKRTRRTRSVDAPYCEANTIRRNAQYKIRPLCCRARRSNRVRQA
jgi:hypothetical protein